MGTDLEETIKRIEGQIEYYVQCCNPDNKEDVLESMGIFFAIMKGEK